MALQPYSDPGQALAIYQAEQIPPEELERRQKEVRETDSIGGSAATGNAHAHLSSIFSFVGGRTR